jgi:hypothetical protein
VSWAERHGQNLTTGRSGAKGQSLIPAPFLLRETACLRWGWYVLASWDVPERGLRGTEGRMASFLGLPDVHQMHERSGFRLRPVPRCGCPSG